MIVFFAFLSLAGLVIAVAFPAFSDLMLLAGPCLVASLWLLWRAGKKKDHASAPAKHHVIIDGSNVMHWQDGKPSLDPVIGVVGLLTEQGLTPGVIFDANAGYKTHDRYQDDGDMARCLGLPEDRVLVVPKGVQADPYILKAARDLGARVVTNDRYRDWQADFPEVARPGFLIRGGMREGAVWLNDRDLQSGVSVVAGP